MGRRGHPYSLLIGLASVVAATGATAEPQHAAVPQDQMARIASATSPKEIFMPYAQAVKLERALPRGSVFDIRVVEGPTSIESAAMDLPGLARIVDTDHGPKFNVSLSFDGKPFASLLCRKVDTDVAQNSGISSKRPQVTVCYLQNNL